MSPYFRRALRICSRPASPKRGRKLEYEAALQSLVIFEEHRDLAYQYIRREIENGTMVRNSSLHEFARAFRSEETFQFLLNLNPEENHWWVGIELARGYGDREETPSAIRRFIERPDSELPEWTDKELVQPGVLAGF